MLDFIFFIFYCAAKDDGLNTKYLMTVYGLELVSTMILSFFTYILAGVLNLKINIFIIWIVLIAINAIVSSHLINKYYIRTNRYLLIIEKYKDTSKSKRKWFKVLVLFLFIFSFILAFTGGMIMNYLFSLHLK